MARKTRSRVEYRRKRQGKTDYKMRLKLLLAEKPRLVIRKSSRSILIQLIEYQETGDRIIATTRSSELKKHGWSSGFGSIPAAYLTGYMAAKNALSKGTKEAIADIGLQARGGRLYAAIKGALDGGLKVPFDEKAVPDQSRLDGEHINKDIAKIVQQVKEKIK